jgi:acyl carrier protein
MPSQPETNAAPAVDEAVRRFIADVFFVEGFSDTSSFLEEGIIDSTGMLELVMFLETTYGISIAQEELIPENLDSLTNVAAFIARKTRG